MALYPLQVAVTFVVGKYVWKCSCLEPLQDQVGVHRPTSLTCQHSWCVPQVIAAGCPLNAYNGTKGNGCTPLVLSACRGQLKVMQMHSARLYFARTIDAGTSAVQSTHAVVHPPCSAVMCPSGQAVQPQRDVLLSTASSSQSCHVTLQV